MSAISNIDIMRPDGTLAVNATIADTSQRVRNIMAENYIQIDFVSPTYIDIPVGSRISYGGFRFVKTRRQVPTYNGAWQYSEQFDDADGFLRTRRIKYYGQDFQEMSFALTANLSDFADLIVKDVNKEREGASLTQQWEKGTIDAALENSLKTISFSGDTLFDACTAIAQEFETEWYITKYYVSTGTGYEVIKLNFCKKEVETDVPFEAGTGKILNAMNPQRGDDAEYGSRFFVFGGTRNLTDDYKEVPAGSSVPNLYENRLHLPNNQAYIDARNGQIVNNLAHNEVLEQYVTFDDIYPKNRDTITSVSSQIVEDDQGNQYRQYTIQANDCPFAGKGDIIDTLGIKFETGELAGQEFEAQLESEALPWNKRLIIVAKNLGTDGQVLYVPNEQIKPSAGDVFVLTGVKLPTSKITDAENELLDKAEEYAKQHSTDTDVYECISNNVYCYEHPSAQGYDIGTRVKLINASLFGANGRSSRVQGVVYSLTKPYEITWQVGDNTKYSRFGNVSTTLEEVIYSQRLGVIDDSLLNLIKSTDYQSPSDDNIYTALAAYNHIYKKHDHKGRLIRPAVFCMPTASPSEVGFSLDDNEIALYASSLGEYSATPSGGGGTGTIYDLVYSKNGTLISRFNVGTAEANLNVTINYSDVEDSTHKMVTPTQISAWSAKQDAISDLATIRANASSGATAYGWGDHALAGYASQSAVNTAIAALTPKVEAIPFIEGGSSDTAGHWTGSYSGITELTEGLTIIFVPSVAGASGTTLNINGLGAKACYTTNTTTLGTQYAAGTPILFTYCDNGWRRADYNSDTVNARGLQSYYERAKLYSASNPLYRYKICGYRDGRIVPIVITNQESATQVNKEPTSVALDTKRGLVYYSATTTINTDNGTIGSQTIHESYQMTTCSYTFNVSVSTYTDVYLQGTYDHATGLFSLDRTQTSNNYRSYYVLAPKGSTYYSVFTTGKYYWFVGAAYSTANYIQLKVENPVYYYNGTALIPVEKKVLDDALPTKVSELINDSGYVTSAALSGYATETYVGNQIAALNLGTASQKDYTTSVSQNGTGLPTSGAVYSAIAAAVTSALHYRGISSVALTDGGTETAVIGGVSLVAQAGDVVIYNGLEFLWEKNGSNTYVWNKLGDDASYALKTVQVIAGTGLTGGGNLSANVTISLSQATITSLGKADTALQSSDLNGYVNEIEQGNGNYVTGITKSGKKLTITRATLPTTIAWSNVTGKPTALSDFTDDILSGYYLPLSAGYDYPLTDTLYSQSIIPTADVTYSIGTDTRRFGLGYFFFLSSTIGQFSGVDASSLLSIPKVAPDTTDDFYDSTKVYLYASSLGEYSETPSGGGGTATVYDLTYQKNGTTVSTINLGTAAGTINVTVGWSDLTPDASHRFVSDTEKTTWNNKQNAISDLATIRSNASTAYTRTNVQQGSYLTTDNSGHLQVDVQELERDRGYISSIPIASSSVLGAIKVGDYLMINSTTGVLSVDYQGLEQEIEEYLGLGTAAYKDYTTSVTSGSSSLVTSGAVYTAVNAKYTKPSTGIPKTDLASAVQTTLSNADTAYGWGNHASAGYLTSSSLDGYVNEIATGTGNYISGVSKSGKKLTFTYGTLPTTIAWESVTGKPATISGYGITDAKIANGTITLGSNSITPLTSFTETDPTVPSWAKASSKPTYTLDEVADGSTRKLSNYVPTTRTINSKALSSNITLSLDDIADGSTRKLADYVSKVNSTDNAVARFNGTGGAIQNSGVLIDDSNNLSLPLGSSSSFSANSKLIIGNAWLGTNTAGALSYGIISGSAYNSYFAFEGTGLRPANSSSAGDNKLNIGTSTVRFKDAYFGGTINTAGADISDLLSIPTDAPSSTTSGKIYLYASSLGEYAVEPWYGFNQLISNGNMESTTGWGTVYSGYTRTVENNVLTLTITSATYRPQVRTALSVANGHWVYYTYTMRFTTSAAYTDVKTAFLYPTPLYIPTGNQKDADYYNWKKTSGIVKVNAAKTYLYIGRTAASSHTLAVGDTVQIKNVMVCDLTEMFGDENIPTVAQFEAMYPQEYYDYTPIGG